jgi:predicted acylesterase/phospholipase RssA
MYTSFLKNKNYHENITFIELFKITKKTLSIIVTNYNKCCEENMNYITHPNLSVALAVRMSSSIPIIFNPIKYNNNWYIDGAVLNNFPIKYCNPKTTLGIYINHQTNNDFNHILDFIKGIVTIISHHACHKDIQDNNLHIIKINAYSKTFDLEINKETKSELFVNGETYVKEYINNLSKLICSQIINDIINQL